ncbi:MAG TPA: SHOCT domain-containing protein [Jatrophihabitantaceae bacterium]|jgi:hypothetical protein|nr:SHOCT domain-containing protein [Jatrophihabitantaceae bacterium]
MTNPRDLVQLRALYQAGLLTEDEYTDARRRLLGYKVKRGRAVAPSRAPDRAAPPARAPRTAAAPNSHRDAPPRRNPNSDLPMLFALAALAVVALAATIWLLMG